MRNICELIREVTPEEENEIGSFSPGGIGTLSAPDYCFCRENLFRKHMCNEK